MISPLMVDIKVRNKKLIRQLNIQLQDVATLFPIPLRCNGNISELMVQTVPLGPPQKAAKYKLIPEITTNVASLILNTDLSRTPTLIINIPNEQTGIV